MKTDIGIWVAYNFKCNETEQKENFFVKYVLLHLVF